MGVIWLTLREIAIDIEGDALHIDAGLKETFPVMNSAGECKLLRPGKTNNLVMIEPLSPRRTLDT